MCVDQASLFVLDSHVSGPEDSGSPVRRGLIATMGEHAVIPARVWVRKKEVFEQLQPLAEVLGFDLKLMRRLRALDQAQRALDRFLRG